jgi:hypothetical protein
LSSLGSRLREEGSRLVVIEEPAIGQALIGDGLALWVGNAIALEAARTLLACAAVHSAISPEAIVASATLEVLGTWTTVLVAGVIAFTRSKIAELAKTTVERRIRADSVLAHRGLGVAGVSRVAVARILAAHLAGTTIGAIALHRALGRCVALGALAVAAHTGLAKGTRGLSIAFASAGSSAAHQQDHHEP